MDSNDGKFFITIEEYLEHLEYTNINFDVTDAYQAYFLVLNDTYVKRGSETDCGVNCTMHQFFIESEIDQEILISAHTWDIKQYMLGCSEHAPEKNVLWVPSEDYAFYFNQGSVQLPSIYMNSTNGTDVFVFMNYLNTDREYVLGKDFSLVVWGKSGGKITITHVDGLESDSFVNYERDAEIDIIFMQDFSKFELRTYLQRYNLTEFAYDKLHNLEDFDFSQFKLTEFMKEYDLSGVDLAIELPSEEYDLETFDMRDYIKFTYGEFYLDFQKIEEEDFVKEMFRYVKRSKEAGAAGAA